MLQYLVIVAALIQLVGVSVYIRGVLCGTTKPNKVTWLMWSMAPLIATIAALSKGVTWAALPVFMSGFAPLLVFIASFVNKQSYWKLTSFDYICGTLSLLAIILWLITKDANTAIIFAIASDGTAAIPTIIKSWKHPETESAWPYATGLFNALSSFTAIKMANFASLGFPIYLIIVNLTLTFAVFKKGDYPFRAEILIEARKDKM